MRTHINPTHFDQSTAVNTASDHSDVPSDDVFLSDNGGNFVALIHPSRLFRDCFSKALRSSTSYQVVAYCSASEWQVAELASKPNLFIVALPEVDEDRDQLVKLAQSHRVMAIGELEDRDQIVGLLDAGIKAYIPASLPLNVLFGAMQVVEAGGTFVPANCLLERVPANPAKEYAQFTAKQLAVIGAIRQGKANKAIAYDLNMCESTVKVHVRNIMKKMNVRNRTQIAFFGIAH